MSRAIALVEAVAIDEACGVEPCNAQPRAGAAAVGALGGGGGGRGEQLIERDLVREVGPRLIVRDELPPQRTQRRRVAHLTSRYLFCHCALTGLYIAAERWLSVVCACYSRLAKHVLNRLRTKKKPELSVL